MSEKKEKSKTGTGSENLALALANLTRLMGLEEANLPEELKELLPLLITATQQPQNSQQLEKILDLAANPASNLELLEKILPLFAGIQSDKPALQNAVEKITSKISEQELSVPGFSPYEALREALAKNSFGAQLNTPWPTALLQEGNARGLAQLIPTVMDEQPLMPPVEVEKWSQLMWKQREELTDLDADALDMLSHIWLYQAGSADDYAVAGVDDFLEMRGLKPKRGGDGRRGGFETEQRGEMLKALSHIQNLWLNMGEIDIVEEKTTRNRKPRLARQGIQSRAFVITDRMGQVRLDGNLDVQRFAFRPGILFARFLYGPGRQTALLSAKAVQYDPYRQKWEKRLARYLSWQWRVRAQFGDYNRPYQVKALLEAVGDTFRVRYPSKSRERLEKALETLKEDEVISGWQYAQWEESAVEQKGWAEKWVLATILIIPPQTIRETYRFIRKQGETSAGYELAQHTDETLAELVKQKRKQQRLSQAQAARELEVSQSYICKLERGQVELSPELRKRLEGWLSQPDPIMP